MTYNGEDDTSADGLIKKVPNSGSTYICGADNITAPDGSDPNSAKFGQLTPLLSSVIAAVQDCAGHKLYLFKKRAACYLSLVLTVTTVMNLV